MCRIFTDRRNCAAGQNRNIPSAISRLCKAVSRVLSPRRHIFQFIQPAAGKINRICHRLRPLKIRKMLCIEQIQIAVMRVLKNGKIPAAEADLISGLSRLIHSGRKSACPAGLLRGQNPAEKPPCSPAVVGCHHSDVPEVRFALLLRSRGIRGFPRAPACLIVNQAVKPVCFLVDPQSARPDLSAGQWPVRIRNTGKRLPSLPQGKAILRIIFFLQVQKRAAAPHADAA